MVERTKLTVRISYDEAVDRLKAAGVPFTLAWQMRVDPHNVQAKQLLADGRFGRVFMVRRRHCL